MAFAALVVAGLYLGSFANALAGRLAAGRPVRESLIGTRSSCARCGHALAPWDLAPVLSWLLLRGRCRYCGGPIDDGPVVELVMPALFVVSYLAWPGELGIAWFVAWLALCASAVGLATYALRRRVRATS
jgi:prepilin signal peptidase PulO-like enzyme (type II secretory pathway)